MHRLDVNYRQFVEQEGRLTDVINNLTATDPRLQKLIAELVMVRLFSLVEEHLRSITLKVLCGARYVDATSPTLIVPCRNMRTALDNIIAHGRTRPLHANNVKWTNVAAIKGNVGHLLIATEHMLTVLDQHSLVIDEMRNVRNHIAHGTEDTRRKFKRVVNRHYGATPNNVTPGVLLLSSRQTPILINQYIVSSRIIVRDMIKM